MDQKVINLGPQELDEFELNEFRRLVPDAEWIVYYYDMDSSEGHGELVLYAGGILHILDLSHCSCGAPYDKNMGDMATVSTQEFLAAAESIHDVVTYNGMRETIDALLHEEASDE